MKKSDILGLGALPDEVESETPETEETPSVEGTAIDTIAERIIDVLKEREDLRPTSWGEVLRGLELVLKFRTELRGKGSSNSDNTALDALREFKEVVKSFEKE